MHIFLRDGDVGIILTTAQSHQSQNATAKRKISFDVDWEEHRVQ